MVLVTKYPEEFWSRRKETVWCGVMDKIKIQEGLQGVKRKRTQNTTSDQYLLYIEAMERDYSFRSGTVNPTVPPDYIEKKWEELTAKLNAIGKGPALTKENWQKRFKDWKNATRAKYRKMVECRKATGGGIVEVKGELTPLEERGLEVWDKVSVTGTPLVSITGGISGPTVVLQEKINECEEPESNFFNTTNEFSDTSDVQEGTTETITIIGENFTQNTSEINLPKMKKKTKSKTTLKPLNETAEDLKMSCEKNTEVLSDISNNLKLFIEAYKQRGKTDERRLHFEILKFKYDHSDFVFDEMD